MDNNVFEEKGETVRECTVEEEEEAEEDDGGTDKMYFNQSLHEPSETADHQQRCARNGRGVIMISNGRRSSVMVVAC